MKASVIAASAALLGSAAASAHNNHAALHFRRNPDVCTVYTTVYVYPSEIPAPVYNSTVYAAPSSTPCTEEHLSTPAAESTSAYVPPPPPPSSYAPAPVPSKEAHSQAPPPPPVYTPAPAPSKPAEEEKPKPSKPANTPTYGGNGRIVTNGDRWAITYTPYNPEGECRTLAEVQVDIAKIAELGFTTIRTYSTDCGVFEHVVPEAQKHGLKVIFGIFLEGGGKGGKGPFSDYANQQLTAIIKNAPKDAMAMLIVGNEPLFNQYCTADELAAYIDYVREQIRAAGFPDDVAVTTTDTVDAWEQHGAALCAHIDVFTVQVHPFFTSKIEASKAGEFAKEQLEKAAAVCPEAAARGKYITEIGWPTAGNANGEAHPGYAEQKEAIKSILKYVGKEACLFSYDNDGWKHPGPLGVEQYFGCTSAIAAA